MTDDRLRRPGDTTTPSRRWQAERDRRRRLEAERLEREQKRATAAERRLQREHEQARKQARDQAAEQSRQALDQEIARLRALNAQRPIMPAACRSAEPAKSAAEVRREAAQRAPNLRAAERQTAAMHRRSVRVARFVAFVLWLAFALLALRLDKFDGPWLAIAGSCIGSAIGFLVAFVWEPKAPEQGHQWHGRATDRPAKPRRNLALFLNHLGPTARLVYAVLALWVLGVVAWQVVDAVAKRLPDRSGGVVSYICKLPENQGRYGCPALGERKP